MSEEIRVGDPKVPVQEEKKLLLHQIDFRDGEPKILVALDG